MSGSRAGGAQVKQSGLRRFVPSATPAAQPAGTAGAAEAATAAQPGTAQAERVQPETAQPAEEARRAPEEACEFCAAPVSADHGHVADLDASTLMCACRACYLLFTHPGASSEGGRGGGWGQADGEVAGGWGQADGEAGRGSGQPDGAPPAGQARHVGRSRYRSIPDRYLSDPERPVSAAEWDALEIPVGLAFFLRSSRDDTTTAFYPSPAGATECRLDLEAWGRIGADHPLLAAADPDVEAVLISRDQRGVEAFLVPIDACYELAGRMRLLWRGFDGGAEARQSITDFLDRVRERSRDFRPES
jgi:hypothetical protein